MTRLGSVATPQLDALKKQHGPLGSKLLQLRRPQQDAIANAAYEEGMVLAMNALFVQPDALAHVMRQAGYDQCGGCEEWFPELELEEIEWLEAGTELGAAIENPPNYKRCEDCKLAEDDDWAAPPPPEPTTPEEIAAAEEKRSKARQAVIDQEARKAERDAILKEHAEQEPDAQ